MSDTYSEYAVKVPAGLLAVIGMKKEYETIFIDGTVEIAVIYNKSRRKKKFICEMKEVQGFFLGRREDAVRWAKVSKDFSSRRAGQECCVMKVATEKGVQVVCFEPGEELAGILRRFYRPQMVN